MLFPELGPQYLSETDRPLLARMEAFYAESITINQSFWQEADIDTRFFSGDQTVFSDLYGNLPANRRRQFSFNRIRRVVNMISGHQRRNRKSTIATAIENGDSETSDQFTKVLMHINQQEGVLETISESFEGALVTGMNLLQVWVDYRSDPISGTIRVDNCSYNAFLIDPYFRKSDLSDCNSVWKRSFLTKREVISLLPDFTKEVLGLWGNDTGTGRDGKFQFMPESYGYSYKNLLTYDEFYYRDYRTQKMLVDTNTGESTEWRSSDEEQLRAFLKSEPSIMVVDQEIPTVRMAIVVQGKVFYDGPQSNGLDRYPFVPVLGYYTPQMPYFDYRIQGVVRGLRDAQYLYNRRKIIELDILESQVTSGFIYKENSLVNPKDIFMAGQGKGIALKDEAMMTDVTQIQAPQIPPSMIELSKILAEEIQQISGVSEELLGSASDDVAGVLSMLRQGAGLTTLQTLFDQLDRSQKLLGSLMIDLIQTNYTPGKVKKILETQEPTNQFYNKAFGKYDAVIEEGMNTTTQKQMEFAQLLQLRELGVPVTNADLIDKATIQGKKELIENMQKEQQQAQQMQQQQAQIQMEEMQARTQLAHARAAADIGLRHERDARVESDKALAIEKIHEANQQDELALLNKVKVLKELETMDIGHIQQLLAMANELKLAERAQVPGNKESNSSAGQSVSAPAS